MPSTTLRPVAACCAVPGVDGPSRDAVLVRDRLLGVADASPQAPGAADQLLKDLAAQLGPRPRGGDLRPVLERLLVAPTAAGMPLGAALAGVAVAVVEAGVVTVAQVGSARAFLVRGGRLLPRTTADPAGVACAASPVHADDQYLLCTDGLWRSLDTELLARVASQQPVDACVRFHQLALAHTTADTAAVVFRLAAGG